MIHLERDQWQRPVRVIWRMSATEAIDIGHAIMEQFPRPDMAFEDAARLLELGMQIREAVHGRVDELEAAAQKEEG